MRLRERLLVTALVVLALTTAGTLGGLWPPWQASREVLLFLHALGAVLFLGNVVTGAAWFTFATLSRSAPTLRFVVGCVNWADVMFTVPGALLLVFSGAALAPAWGGVAGQGWLTLSLSLFGLAGLLWAVVLVPLQIYFARVVEGLPPDRDPVLSHPPLKKWFAVYGAVGGLSALAALGTLAAMTVKPG